MQKFTRLAFIILSILMLTSVVKNAARIFAIKREIEREKVRIAKIEEENKKLEEEVSKMQSIDFIEKEIRDKLGLVKEGETVVVLPEDEVLRKLAPKISYDDDVLPKPNWEKWLDLFI